GRRRRSTRATAHPHVGRPAPPRRSDGRSRAEAWGGPARRRRRADQCDRPRTPGREAAPARHPRPAGRAPRGEAGTGARRGASHASALKYGGQLPLTKLMVRVVNDSLTIANGLRPALLRLARQLRRETHSLGVSSGQVSLLIGIKNQPGITAAELAEREHISAPGMSGHLVRLEAAGLIRRERASDRRRIG